ncbi:MAG: glutamine amidotransferase [archaeon]|nr:glutamine amidotransferase [archaeon]MCP8313044.1 glutamine amidotransferase [archaeon]MCP8316587.1 glutamine amidotransferase [archaeon]MCP8319608.1 glutamine amidotransferase [archaeon]
MCGIAGLLSLEDIHVGKLLVNMMDALQHRGKDSAGVAMYNKSSSTDDEYILRIFTRDIIGAASGVATAIAKAGGDIRSIQLNPINGFGFDRYIIRAKKEYLERMVHEINSTKVSRVLSIGHCMEIIKDVCTVEELDKRFKVSDLNGTHGIGHVRFSTESKVDLFHAHPFQSFNYPDIAVVHNGQITNYYKMRDRLERRGHRFETENDSELIVHYVSDRLENGLDLEEALNASVKELDGPFSYIISMPDAIGVAKDKLGLRPALALESDKIFAIASEEVALRILGHTGNIRNLRPGEVVTWRR